MRLAIVDGFRGIFLIFMVVIHANEILKTIIGKLNHHYFGWVEDAQGFVFMSGLVVGLVYGGRYLRHGFDAMSKSVWMRIRTIYSHQFFLIALFLTITLFCLQLGLTVPKVLHAYQDNPVLFSALSFSLVTGSMHLGILPMYIFFMMLTPNALRLLNSQRYLTLMSISIACWAIAQSQVIDQFVVYVENLLALNGHQVGLGIYFNIFGWQVLYFGGLMIGFLMVSKRLNTKFLELSEMRTVFFICVIMFVFYGIYDRIVFDNWIGRPFSDMVKTETDRGNFSLIYLITFVVDLIIVVWLLGPGKTDKNRVVRFAAELLFRFITLRPFVFLGQHSLHVFSAHIVIVYSIAAIFPESQPDEWIGILVIVSSVMLLFIVAWLHSLSVARKKVSIGQA